MTREWFQMYCQNAAANVLTKDNKIRFTYEQLKAGLDAVADHSTEGISNDILNLHDNIVKLCNVRNGDVKLSQNDEYTLVLTLLNIHAAYLMLSGLWKEEPIQSSGTDEYGFEIF